MSTVVYIDGQNFLYKVAEILLAANLISDKQDLTSIDINLLISTFIKNDGLEIRYYGVKHIYRNDNYGEEILEKSIRFSDSLRRFKNYLAKNNIKYIPKGSLKVRITDECKNCGYIDYKFQEKGVDVGLAVDLVRDALEHNVDHIILLSSDTDLLPALQIVKEKNIKLSYIAFKKQVTVSLAKIADQVFYLENQQVINAYLKSLNR
ncbi:NYN domain-containing protein [Candidatus Saccharibacteria bacterium]|nr:NYN domain-containing protein [Candidatus Saccharibacteria bacterium]MBR6122203.1 NYN domain-containing protein [Candidatus Saccharibacteria bacterium]